MTLNLSNPEPFAARTDLPCKPPAGATKAQIREFADDWFPEREAIENRNAPTLCANCPVIAECGTWALETQQEWGIWGGMSSTDRRRIIRNGSTIPVRRRNPSEVGGKARTSCGTVTGYRAHQRHNEISCAECLDAEANRSLARRAAKKETAA